MDVCAKVLKCGLRRFCEGPRGRDPGRTVRDLGRGTEDGPGRIRRPDRVSGVGRDRGRPLSANDHPPALVHGPLSTEVW